MYQKNIIIIIILIGHKIIITIFSINFKGNEEITNKFYFFGDRKTTKV